MKLSRDYVALRPLTEADLPMTLAWRNRDDVRIWFVHSDPITRQQHADWFAAYLERANDVVWIVEANGEPCGQVSLYDITQSQAEFGRMMIGVERWRGNGVGRLACALVTEYGLCKLGLERVFLRVLTRNIRAICLYEDCGFKTVVVKGRIQWMERTE